MSKPTCSATTTRGQPCKSWPLPSGDRCAMHAPELREQLQKARAKGGRSSSRLRMLKGKRARLDSAASLVAFTSSLIQDTLAGEVPPEVARCVLYGVSIERQLLETSDIERRLADLERQARWA